MAKKSFKVTGKWYLILLAIDALAMALGWMHPVKLTLFLLVQLILVMYFDSKKNDWRLVIAAGILGPLVEILAIWGGALSYAAPFILGFPIWGALMYANGALLLQRIINDK
ncbi:MAG: DUF2878 family protein [bacterium]|nr:DUF2878 family protein [bacterium]